MQRRILLLFVAFVSTAIACSDSVSPQDQSLDGPWSTGLLFIGVGMSVTLTWTNDRVSGSGAYAAVPDSGARCGTGVIVGDTTLVFSATRRSSTQLSGQIVFGTGAPFQFQGTLMTSTPPGLSSIDATLVAADGSTCGFILHQGLIP